MIDPFVALMRRYVIDYTNSHDLSVCDDIMVPEYVVRISDMTLERDTAYRPAVGIVFAQFPGLCLAIHEIVTNGDRLAMRFAEHGADVQRGGHLSCWTGIALYRWNGDRLTECRVEQDFLSRERQIETGRHDSLESPHLDPWTTTRAVPADADAERVATEWLRAGDLGAAASGRIDDADVTKFDPVVEARSVEIHDLFSAGEKIALHASISGAYRGGLPGTDDHRGADARLDLAGIVTVSGGKVADARVVTDRLGLAARLTGRPLF